MLKDANNSLNFQENKTEHMKCKEIWNDAYAYKIPGRLLKK